MERITGLDLATRLCGWCTGAGDDVPACGAWEFSYVADDIGRMLDQLDHALRVHVERYRPTKVIYEAPILRVRRPDQEEGFTDDLLKIRKLYNLGGHLEWRCRTWGIGYAEVSIQAIKKELTGDRHADKDAMVEVARLLGIQLPEGEGAKDAADAAGAWLKGVRKWNPEMVARWDAKLYPLRGALL